MIFWTADHHFGHENIREYEPGRQALGPDVDAMNDALIERWNAAVRPDDQVYIVGDLCMGKIGQTLPLVEKLNGEKFMFGGNHDRWWGTMAHAGEDSKRGRMWARWSAAYEEVGLYLVSDTWVDMTVGDPGYLVRVCHFPYSGDHTTDARYPEHRPPDAGHVLIHGHVHSMWKTNGRQINVGCDVWDYAPVAETVLSEEIEKLS